MIYQYVAIGIILSLIYATIEYLAKVGSTFPEPLLPLLIRGGCAGILIAGSAAILEILAADFFQQRTFSHVVFFRSVAYTFIITFWLIPINGIWEMIGRDQGFSEGIKSYLGSEGYRTNLLVIFVLLVVIFGIKQINSLHKKGELWRFITGRYHHPMEVLRMFCFIDLKSSTTIAEKLGHLKFGSFLKDYYSDITESLKQTDAEIYQYVGDEIILMWSYKMGIRNSNAIECFFKMRDVLTRLREKYMNKYGVVPEFKAGLHGGIVIVTWVGELKKEIVYVGDVLNTTSRIQEQCKLLNRDFLVSEELIDQFSLPPKFKSEFMKEVELRGKSQTLGLYSLESV